MNISAVLKNFESCLLWNVNILFFFNHVLLKMYISVLENESYIWRFKQRLKAAEKTASLVFKDFLRGQSDWELAR